MASESISRGGQRRAAPARAAVRRTVTAIGARADEHIAGVKPALTRGLTVFVFHEITDTPSAFQRLSAGFVSTEAFRREIEWIGERFVFIAPSEIPALGGRAPLPSRAALITFDDAWAGVFEVGREILRANRVPALCFVNMATVDGTPDLSAVRRYERLTLPGATSRLDQRLDSASAARVLAEINEAYRDDHRFRAFQGPTATEHALAAAVEGGLTWLGSHLFHHWNLNSITLDVFKHSQLANERALARCDRVLPTLATPYGLTDRAAIDCAFELGVELVFVATGRQNRDPLARVLDRVEIEPNSYDRREWWYSTHRRRVLGRLAS